ncbi:MAG TPA: hypothetical protein ENI61_04140 [Ignavibacteria bacterium]|nr:hypothetical protein [Ignavibacteria bacterium]
MDLIITGMHRSGTSITANIAHSIGVNMGADLMPPSKYNPKGYFESIEISEFNEKILNYAGGNWFSPPTKENLNNIFYIYINKIKELIEKNKSEVRGFKDPRISLFLLNYVKLLNKPVVITTFRDIYDIAKSLKRRDNFKINYALNVAIEYYERLVDDFSKINCPLLMIDYEDFFYDKKERNVERIVNFLIQHDEKKLLIEKYDYNIIEENYRNL